MTDHVKDANKYIEQVLSGEVPACEWVRLACQRQLDDLAKQGAEGWEYRFDDDKASRVCNFVENLKHAKGKWAGKLIKLERWQKFIITTVFGWVNILSGYRRFNSVYTEVPRKNAKSTLTAAIALYMLVADGEEGAEVYSAATTKDQAKIVFNAGKNMAKKSPDLRSHYGVEVGAHNIHVLETASKFEALSAEGSTLDGLNTHFGSNDELHAHKTRVVYDVIETSTGSRTQSIIWNITTAGTNRAGICYELRTDLIKILQGLFKDESIFGIIYTIDKEDDWTKPESWVKANPNWDVSVFPGKIEQLAGKAIRTSTAQNNFKTKHLNVWVNADTAWMNMIDWDKCADESLKLEDFAGKTCFMGLDLASKIDLASLALLFPDGEGYALFVKHYLPEDMVKAGNHATTAHYDGWAKDGLIELTPGNMIDQDYIKADLIQFLERFDVQEIAFDPWQAAKLSTELGNEGAVMVEIRPSVQNFSDPMKMFEALVISGKIRHNGCPVMTWMVSNVVAHMDKKDNIYPNKEKPENKIDGVVAMLMAMNRGNHFLDEGGSVYEERGVLMI